MKAWVLKKGNKYWDGYYAPTYKNFGSILWAHYSINKKKAAQNLQTIQVKGTKIVQIEIKEITRQKG